MTRTKRHPSDQDVKAAVDAAIFTVRGGRLHLLLIRMKKRPFTGRWALPGGLIGQAETTRAAATRILREQTGVRGVYLDQFGTFDDPRRDPFGRVISVAHFALVPDVHAELRTTDKYSDVRWQRADRLPPLAYDHRRIAAAAIGRLRVEVGRSNIAWSLLPREFTLRELLDAYQAILGRRLDKRNFLKKVLALRLVAPTGRRRAGAAHRPAALFRFRSRTPAAAGVL